MLTLLLLRHAKSSWKHPDLDDHDRPLNKRGKRDAPRVGALLAEQKLALDLVLCSSARRARDTAFGVLPVAGYHGEVRISRALYMAAPEAFVDALAALERDFSCVLVIGHNPGLEELIEALAGERSELSTAALALLELDIEHWSEIALGKRQARLERVWLPRELT